MVAANDTDSLKKLNYISFSSSDDKSLVRVFFDCPFDYPFIDTDVSTKYTLIGHPLLDDPEFKTIVDKRNCKFYKKILNFMLSKLAYLKIIFGI